MKIICRKSQKLFSAYVDGMLPEKAKKSFANHLDSCPECRKALHELELLRELLREFPEKQPGLGFETAILSRVREKPEVTALRSWSRRASYGLAGLAALLIITIYLQKPVLTPQLNIARTPAPGGLAVKEKKTEPTLKQKPLARSADAFKSQEQASSSVEGPPSPQGLKVRLRRGEDKGEGDKRGNSDTIKSEMPAAPQVGGSIAGAEYAAVSKQEAGKPDGALRETAKISVEKETRLLVIRNKTDWAKTWNSQNTSQNLSLPLPEVDFKKQMVVALPTNQAGREYEIVKTEEKPDRIIVQYRANPTNQSEAVIIPPPPYQLEVVNTKPSVELQKLD